MEKYNFSFNGEHRGHISFDGSEITLDFLRPSDQDHFEKEVALLEPKNIAELIRSGYSYWDITKDED
jgi:hypothetical protein